MKIIRNSSLFSIGCNRPRLEAEALACPAQRGESRFGRPRWASAGRTGKMPVPRSHAVVARASSPCTWPRMLSGFRVEDMNAPKPTPRRNGRACQGRTARGRGFMGTKL